LLFSFIDGLKHFRTFLSADAETFRRIDGLLQMFFGKAQLLFPIQRSSRTDPSRESRVPGSLTPAKTISDGWHLLKEETHAR